ncbi:sodium:proton antiporter [Paenibacillus sp. N1-5-1-14]|uniref:cation:proton antiporter n=1 Tax=Paenibacillus radicibacter TaxID=2972488 RepID=UPI00215913BF|nr:sodium:proton antiporter [Paenibacillus radicibacter]MCR8645246.1 sodium:proton antiporter [Paenibacillus radicibacter]
MNELIHHVLFLIVFICGVGMIFGKVARWLRLPDVALFLIAGMIVGQGLHLVSEESASFTNQFILVLGSVLILFDGGRNIQLSGLKKVWVTVTMLSIPGVFITCAVVAVSAHYLLGLPWLIALLLGTVICSTDPATLIPVFKQVKIKPKVRETVESESAFNDATGSILTFSVLAIVMGTGDVTIASGVLKFLKTAIGGLLVGGAIGYVVTYITAHLKFGFLREYATVAMLVTALGSYLVGETFGFSGFMATFTAGLIWGNAKTLGFQMEDKLTEMGHFTENITFIMRMLIFVLLGSQVNFGVIFAHLWPSIGVILVFMFIARPLTVFISAWPDRKAKWTFKELAFMSWVRETGVIPAALSGMVTGMGVPHADIIASVTFIAILFTIVLQASSTGYVAKKLGIALKE